MLIFIFRGFIFNKPESVPNIALPIITPLQFPYEVLVEGFSIKVINNQDKILNLSVTYRRHSQWFGINDERTVEFLVPPKQEKSIVDEAGTSNIATSNVGFSISVISYKEN